MWALKLDIMFVGRLVFLGFLALTSVLDIRTRKIPDWLLILGSILVTAFCVFAGDVPMGLSIAGLLTGAGFLMVSRATKEAVGYGDSWMLCIAGSYLGIWKLIEVLVAAWVFLAVAAMICLIWKKWSRKAALPMVPFLTAGYVIMLIQEQVHI